MLDFSVKRIEEFALGLFGSAKTAEPDIYEQQYRAELDTNHDGSISVDEMTRFAQARSRVPWIPLSSMLAVERRLGAESPQLVTAQQRLAKELVTKGGRAEQLDVDVVAASLVHLPMSVLIGMQRAGIRVVACRDAVTDYLPDLKDQLPRGHSKAHTWDKTPAASNGNEVVIATVEGPGGARIMPRKGKDHGSYDVFLHELGHSIERHIGQFRGVATDDDASESDNAADFLAAREHDWDRLKDYYQQEGKGVGAGADEAFAESFARFYGNDPKLASDWPELYRYWNESNRTAIAQRVPSARTTL